MIRLFSAVLAAIVLGACATSPSSKTPPLLQKLEENGIDSRTYHKIASGRVLTYDDIVGLVKDNVPDPVIVSYLQSTKAPYQLTNAQLENLTNLGAGSDLVNYLGKSTGFFDATQRAQTGGAKWDKHSYFTDPYFYGAAPFPYAFPDEWYDPGVYNAWF
ncbi:MAG: hypothetical protein SFU53_06570 [Terrimicrobiaceae bacterium]|nr:hypothetical protein [Terrimicrobiaceae bacterium]